MPPVQEQCIRLHGKDASLGYMGVTLAILTQIGSEALTGDEKGDQGSPSNLKRLKIRARASNRHLPHRGAAAQTPTI